MAFGLIRGFWRRETGRVCRYLLSRLGVVGARNDKEPAPEQAQHWKGSMGMVNSLQDAAEVPKAQFLSEQGLARLRTSSPAHTLE